jgi:hypothetical protein
MKSWQCHADAAVGFAAGITVLAATVKLIALRQSPD